MDKEDKVFVKEYNKRWLQIGSHLIRKEQIISVYTDLSVKCIVTGKKIWIIKIVLKNGNDLRLEEKEFKSEKDALSVCQTIVDLISVH